MASKYMKKWTSGLSIGLILSFPLCKLLQFKDVFFFFKKRLNYCLLMSDVFHKHMSANEPLYSTLCGY